ncbi:YceD family protein [Corynebacterium endometrii]|nr:YceD family protein [Corynebacterium endometrii]
MTNPLIFNVASLLRGPDADGMPLQRTQTGPAPERIGVEMIAIPEGGELTVDATLTPLGGAIMVDADLRGELQGECSRCLEPLKRELDLHVSQVFAADEDFITGDAADDEDKGSGDETPLIDNDQLDLLQTVIDEAGLSLPFAPVCEGGCEIDEPEGVTTGISGEGEAEESKVDPRWSGLEKFL